MSYFLMAIEYGLHFLRISHSGFIKQFQIDVAFRCLRIERDDRIAAQDRLRKQPAADQRLPPGRQWGTRLHPQVDYGQVAEGGGLIQ